MLNVTLQSQKLSFMDTKIFQPKNVTQYAKEYIQYLEREHNLSIDGAFLFSSYSKGTPRPYSDIDICIISKKFHRVDPLSYLWTRRRETDVTRRIEPVGMHPDDFVDANPLAHEIKQHGKRLK